MPGRNSVVLKTKFSSSYELKLFFAKTFKFGSDRPSSPTVLNFGAGGSILCGLATLCVEVGGMYFVATVTNGEILEVVIGRAKAGVAMPQKSRT
jgi:hypothetical protein